MKLIDLTGAIHCVQGRYSKVKERIDSIKASKGYMCENAYKRYIVVIDTTCALVESLMTLASQVSGSGPFPLYEYVGGRAVEDEVVEKTMLIVTRVNNELAFLEILVEWATTTKKFNMSVSF